MKNVRKRSKNLVFKKVCFHNKDVKKNLKDKFKRVSKNKFQKLHLNNLA